MASKVPNLFGAQVFKQGYAVGVVVGKFHTKTLRVGFKRTLTHKKYGAKITRTTVLQVHDELNEADLGDVIIVKQSRKHSKTKAFELHDIAIKYPAADFLNKNPAFADAMEEINKKPTKKTQIEKQKQKQTKLE